MLMLLINSSEYCESITYSYFLRIANSANSEIKNVSRRGFLYYEAGAMGFGWVYYWFKDTGERRKYHKYLKKHPEFLKRK